MSNRRSRIFGVAVVLLLGGWLWLGPVLLAQEEDPLVSATKLYQQEKYQDAIELLNGYIETLWQAGNQEAKVAEVYYLLAKIYFETRQDEMVEQTLLDLFDLFPSYSHKESNTAFAAFFEKVKTDPLAKARRLMAKEEFDQAAVLIDGHVQSMRVGDKNRKDVADALYLLAKVYYLKQEDPKMNDTLNRLFAIIPGFTNKEESDEAFADIVRRFRSDPLAQARTMVMQRDYGQAVPMLKDFIEKNSLKEDQKESVAEACYLLAKIYYLQRNDEQMKAMLVKLFTSFPEYEKEESNEGFRAEAEKVRAEVNRDAK